MRLSVAKVFWPKLAKGSKRHGCIHGYRIYIQNKSVLCKDLRLGYSWLDAVSAPVPGVQILVSWQRDMHSMAEKKNILVNISNSNANSNLLFHTGRRLVHCAISKKPTPTTTKCCGEMRVSEELITTQDLRQLLLIRTEEWAPGLITEQQQPSWDQTTQEMCVFPE